MAVRREAVRLDVEGNFAEKMFEDAAALEAFRRSVKDLSGTSVQTSRATQALERDVDNASKKFRQGSKDLDSYTGRLGILAQAIAAVAPAVTPIGAVGIGGIAGIANDAGMASTAVASLVVAMHGVIPAIQAVNKAALDPTAANLRAAQLAMEHLTPAARSFVSEFQQVTPLLKQIQGSAASAWFPGLTKAMHDLEPLAPTIEKIFGDVGRMGGNLASQGAKALAGPEWRSFFQFIDTEAPKAMAAMGHVVGSLSHGLAELWMHFQPLNTGFNNWLVSSSRTFDAWATGLDKTQGFQDFLAYVHDNGPKVASAAEAIANAVISIVRAAAPLAGPTLDAITAIAHILDALAASPLGTPIMAMIQLASAMSLVAKAAAAIKAATGSSGSLLSKGLFGAEMVAGSRSGLSGVKGFAADLGTVGKTLRSNVVPSLMATQINLRSTLTASEATAGSFRRVGGAAAGVAVAGVAMSGLADKAGLAHEQMGALLGLMAGGPLGAAIGTTAAAVMDLAHGVGGVAQYSSSMHATMAQANAARTLDQMVASRDALANQYSGGNTLRNGILQIGDWLGMNHAENDARAAGAKYALLQSEIAKKSEQLEVAQLGLSASFVRTAHASGLAGSQLAYMAAQTNAAKSAALDAANAEVGYRDALAAAEKQAKGNNAGINGMSEAARANDHALLNLAAAWKSNLEQMQSNGAGAGRMNKQFDDTRANFIRVAEAMGVSGKEAEALAKKYLAIPAVRQTVIGVIDHATGGIRGVLRALEDLNGYTANAWIKIRTPQAPPNLHGGHIDPSTGTYIPGSPKGHRASGGTIPHDGRPYADRYLYMLAPGEEVISNRHGQADKHRALLKAINADRVGASRATGHTTTVVHRHELAIHVDGEMDWKRAKGQIEKRVQEISLDVSRDTVEQHHQFWSGRR